MEPDQNDGTLVLPIFKKLSKKKKNTLSNSRLPPSNNTQKLTDDDLDTQPDGNAVHSRLTKKSSFRSTPNKSRLSTGISIGDATDQFSPTSNSAKISNRRKLARPDSHTSLNNLMPDEKSVHSSPLSQSSRPTYSTADLKELKSLTLSTSSNRSNDNTLDELTQSKFPGYRTLEEEEDDMSGIDLTNRSISSVQIPSSAFINSAKESRLQARKTGLSSTQLLTHDNNLLSPQPSSAEDFISLSTTHRPSSTMIPLMATKHGESRLVREEDQFGEGDDEHAEYTGAKERVPLGERAGLAAEANKKADMEAMILDAEDDLQEGTLEELEWEAAQIRRGGIGTRDEKTTTERKPDVYQPAPIPEHTTLISLDSLESKSLNLLHLLEQHVAEQTQSAFHFTASEKNLLTQESELREELAKEAQQLEFFQEFEKFINEIDLFFQSKFPKLEKVEQDLLSILKERAELIFQRRYEDLSDDLVLFKNGEIGVTRPATKNNLKSSTTYLVEPNGTGSGDQDGAEGLDELGRTRREFDISSHAPSRSSRRSERSQRRKRRMARKLDEKINWQDDDEGFSTDDSLSPADSSDLLSASRSLIDSGNEILIDVTNPVFLSPTNLGSISDRFLSWRSNYPEQYDNAFGNLALVQAWEFWVRMEMVTGLNIWGLRDWVGTDDKRGIENWEWMRGLERYDHAIQSEGKPINQESVIAAMVSTVVIPFLLPIIKFTYDPFSVKSTTKSLELAEQVSYVLETQNNSTYDKLIRSFLDRFRMSIHELRHLLGNSKEELKSSLRSQIGVEGIQARKRFLFKSFKLFQQGMRWKNFFDKNYWINSSDDQDDDDQFLNLVSHHPCDFKHVLINNLLVQVILPILFISWETGGQSISEQILKICPKDFLSDELTLCLKNGHDSTMCE